MNKREITKKIRDIMSGRSNHTNIIVWKKGRSWKSYTGLNRFSQEVLNEKIAIQFAHCCNEMTLKEANEELGKALVGYYL